MIKITSFYGFSLILMDDCTYLFNKSSNSFNILIIYHDLMLASSSPFLVSNLTIFLLFVCYSVSLLLILLQKFPILHLCSTSRFASEILTILTLRSCNPDYNCHACTKYCRSIEFSKQSFGYILYMVQHIEL